jgi:type II secretory pathway component GspD/PulD (secretin)
MMGMRSGLVAFCVALVASAGAFGAPADDAALVKLQRKQPKVRYEAAALGDALDIVHDMTGVNVVVNWASLEAVAVKKETPITVEYDNVSAADTLDVICRLVGAGKVGWAVRGGVVEVSSRSEMARSSPAPKVYSGIGIGLAPPAERAAAQAELLKQFVPTLGEAGIELKGSTMIVKGDEETLKEAARAIKLCGRAMTPPEWDALMGVAKVLANMKEPMSVQWQEKPLVDCVRELSAKTKVPMVVDASLETVRPVTLRLEGVPPQKVLDGILRAAGTTGYNSKEIPATYEPIGGGRVLWIGSAEKAQLWNVSFSLTPAGLRAVKARRAEEATDGIKAMVPGSELGRMRYVGSNILVVSQRMDQVKAIGQLLMDPGYVVGMKPMVDRGGAAASSGEAGGR